MSCLPDMTPTSLAATVVPRTVVQAKSLKIDCMYSKEEKICYKMVYYTFKLSQSSEIVLQS